MGSVSALGRFAALAVFGQRAAQGALGRYSYVTADPFGWIWPPPGVVNDVPIVLPPADPFDCLADALDRFTSPTIAALPPFQGGAAGLFAYDLCHYLERLPRPRYYDFAIPDLAVGLYDWVISFDHHENKAWLVSTGHPEVEPRRRQARARQRRDQVLRLLERPPGNFMSAKADPIAIAGPHFTIQSEPGVFSNFDKPGYLRALRKAIAYVHAGDCFQVNVAQRLLAPAREPALAIYERLRSATRRRSQVTSTWETVPSPALRRSGLSGCRVAASKRGRSRGRARVASCPRRISPRRRSARQL